MPNACFRPDDADPGVDVPDVPGADVDLLDLLGMMWAGGFED